MRYAARTAAAKPTWERNIEIMKARASSMERAPVKADHRPVETLKRGTEGAQTLGCSKVMVAKLQIYSTSPEYPDRRSTLPPERRARASRSIECAVSLSHGKIGERRKDSPLTVRSLSLESGL